MKIINSGITIKRQRNDDIIPLYFISKAAEVISEKCIKNYIGTGFEIYVVKLNNNSTSFISVVSCVFVKLVVLDASRIPLAIGGRIVLKFGVLTCICRFNDNVKIDEDFTNNNYNLSKTKRLL